ncbi:Integrase core domain-containing protein, partial [Chitinophaga rupis]
SDRGVQYCSEDYIDLLNDNEVAISMTEKGDPYENAIAERMNGILKSEFDLARQFNNYEEAASAVTAAIRIYNQQRPHASCNYLTPEQAATQKGTLLSRWKTRKKTNCKPKSGLQQAIVNFKQDYLTKV